MKVKLMKFDMSCKCNAFSGKICDKCYLGEIEHDVLYSLAPSLDLADEPEYYCTNAPVYYLMQRDNASKKAKKALKTFSKKVKNDEAFLKTVEEVINAN